MKLAPLTAIAAFLVAFCVFAASPASAQSVFAVGGIRVDETAANAAAAQEAGFASAYRQGFERLVRRLTAPADLAAHPISMPEPAALERLVQSVDVESERRSTTRYIGRLGVRFDPAGVRALLRGAGLTVIEARAPTTLVAPLVVTGTDQETATLWREVWGQGGYGNELAPLSVAPDTLQGAPSWATAGPFAQSLSAGSVLYATLRVQGGTATATLAEATANGVQSRGDVTARVSGSGRDALAAALISLAEQANARVQSDWQARNAGAVSGPGGRLSVTALYASQAQWEQIKDALEGAAQSVISEIRIEAVGREGALVSFSFAGDANQVAAELRRRGVLLESGSQGAILRIAR
jgi:hypothetical protein